VSYSVQVTNAFKRDVRLLQKRKYDLNLLKEDITLLQTGEQLPEKFRDHQLSGNLRSFRECHIKPDWLLIYQKHEENIVLVLSRTGTHADLLGK